MTDWNNVQVARNRVAETRKPPHAHTSDYCEWCATGQAPPIKGGQGRSAERVGHSALFVAILAAVAIAYAALAYAVWPTVSKVWQ